MNLNIRRKFNPMFQDPKTWDAFTFLILLAYAVGVFYFQLSFFNYYFLTLIIGFQLYYWISNQEEKLEFDGNIFRYRFLIFKKNFQIKSYQTVHVYYDKNPHSRTREKVYTECLMIQNEKVKFQILKTKHPQDYEKIKDYLIQSFPENKSVKKPFLIFKFVPDFFLFFVIAFFFTFIFTLGIAWENRSQSTIERFAYVQGISTMNSEIKKGSRGSVYMDLKLDKYPDAEFKLYKTEIDELRKNNKIQFAIGDTIGLYLDNQDYYRKLMKYEDYPYFTSHLVDKNKINVRGLFYQNYHFLDPYETIQGETRTDYLFFLLPLIFTIVCVLNIFSNKIKYLKN